MTKHAFIAGYVRTPFTFARKGALAGVRPDDLGAHVVRSLLERTGVAGEEIEDVVWGCAFPEGEQGLNIGRIVGLLAGLPETTAGMTVNRWCGSSIQAVQVAAGMLLMNAGEAFVAGGTESMSKVPMMGFNMVPHPSWSARQVEDFANVGLTAERVSRQFGVHAMIKTASPWPATQRRERHSWKVASRTRLPLIRWRNRLSIRTAASGKRALKS